MYTSTIYNVLFLLKTHPKFPSKKHFVTSFTNIFGSFPVSCRRGWWPRGMTWQIYKVAVFWKTWPRSKGATRAVGLKSSATAKGRSRGDWLLSRYMEIMFFFVFFVVVFFFLRVNGWWSKSWSVLWIFVRKGKYFWGVYSGIVHSNSMLIIHDRVRFLAMGV